MAIPTGRESDKFMLRLPDGMRDRIKAAADANGRSMNAEIVATLEEKYPAPRGLNFDGLDFQTVLAFMEAIELKAEASEDSLRSLSQVLDSFSGGKLELYLDPTKPARNKGGKRLSIREKSPVGANVGGGNTD